jgi:DNA-binding beta-propeller fold protein YncE
MSAAIDNNWRAPRSAVLWLVALPLFTAAILGFASVPSLAARGHEFAGAFGWGVLDGKSELQRCTSQANCKVGLSGDGEGQFEGPNAIAVNEVTGEVYVVDEVNNRVEIFNAAGTEFLGEFDGSGTHLNEGIVPAGFGGGAEEVTTGKFDEPEGVAVDNDPLSSSFGDVYVADTNGHEATPAAPAVVDKFSGSGEYIGQITRNLVGEFPELGFRKLYGVAVDPRGEVWVDELNFGSSPRGIANYTSEAPNKWIGFRATDTGISASAFLAVDSEDNLYVHDTLGGGDRLAEFSESGDPITPEVDEEAPTGVAVEPAGENDVYIAHASSVNRVGSAGVSLERLKAPGMPSFSGVSVNDATQAVYVADVVDNRVDVFAPEKPGPPSIEKGSTAVSDVTSTSASFAAEVNPRSESNEAPTSYSFRYGPCESVEACPASPYTQSIPVPDGTLAPNYEPDSVRAHPQDLLPHTVYHVRVVAHNSQPDAEHPTVVEGEELVFTTQAQAVGGPPDARRWELVSTPDKHGAILSPIEGSGVIQAAANGDAVSYLANAPSESDPQGFSQAVQILSRRGTSAWESQDIATPHEGTVGISLPAGQGEYRFFTEDLSSAIVQPFGPFTQVLSPAASERTAYLREDFPAADPADPCRSSCYRPLVTGCPGGEEPCPRPVEEAANVPEGTKFGEDTTCGVACGPYFLGASPDASHVVLSSTAPLTGEPASQGGLYEWAAGQLALVSELPTGRAVAASAKPGLGFGNEPGTITVTRHAISADGSRVVWSERGGARHLYLRGTGGEEPQTIQLDKPEAACTSHCTGTTNPVFQTASADGSRIFFTDSQPLTNGSGNSDLYECLMEEAEEGGLACRLSDLTPPGAGEEGAGVLGLVAGTSEDGSSLYFTANGKLSEGPSPRGEEAVTGDCNGETETTTPESETAAQRCNLYVLSSRQIRLVAVLSGADFPGWSLRDGYGLRSLTDRVSPDGRWLAFMSRRSLTGYDNRDVVSGRPDQEVFLYDTAANALTCASCNPSSGRPRGVQYAKINANTGGLAGGSQIWPEGAWLAANIPGWTAISETEGFAVHQSRYLSGSGRLFFNSADALVPGDSNRSEDVYEYEPAGVGDCTTAKASFSPGSGGCVALISSGTAKGESAFLDASESGDDVFFLTGERLLPGQDLDSSLDVYDAHACSASSPCLPEPGVPAPACEGDACQSPGVPPEDQTPASLGFQGPGNPTPSASPPVKHKTPARLRAEKLKKALKACHKKRNKHKRMTCERAAHKRYGVGAVRKISNKRRRA